MDFSLSDEQEMLRESARRFVERSYGFDARRDIMRSEAGWREDHWRGFAELGWLGMLLPEELGGFGGSVVETALICEELGRGLVLEPFTGCGVMPARILSALPESDLRAELIEALMTGERRLALAHQEPAARGDRGHVETVAERDGDSYRLTGGKSLVLGGTAADMLLVSALIDGDMQGEAGPALFLVPKDAHGLSLLPYRLADGSRVVDARFDQVPVPPAALLLPPERAAGAIDDALDHGLVALSAGMVGAMEAALWMTRDYLRVRRQFGQPIGNFQALQHRMAEMLIEVEQSRSMLYCGLAGLASSDPAERARGLSAMKAYIAESARFVCGQAIQLHGGMGMTEEYAVGHYLKHAVTFDGLLGNRALHIERYAGLIEETTLDPEDAADLAERPSTRQEAHA